MSVIHWVSSTTSLPHDRSRRLIFSLTGIALILFGIFHAVVPLVIAAVSIGIGIHLLLHNSMLARRMFVRVRRRYPGTLSFFETWRQRRRRRESRARTGRPVRPGPTLRVHNPLAAGAGGPAGATDLGAAAAPDASQNR